MMIKTRLWLGGEVSAQRDAPDPAADRAGEALATSPPADLYRWFGVLHPGHSGDFSRSRHAGQGGRPRLRPWRNILIAQVVKRYERRRVVATERRMVDGTPAPVETLRRRSHGDGVINTAYM